jgi:hypothetical protein
MNHFCTYISDLRPSASELRIASHTAFSTLLRVLQKEIPDFDFRDDIAEVMGCARIGDVADKLLNPDSYVFISRMLWMQGFNADYILYYILHTIDPDHPVFVRLEPPSYIAEGKKQKDIIRGAPLDATKREALQRNSGELFSPKFKKTPTKRHFLIEKLCTFGAAESHFASS